MDPVSGCGATAWGEDLSCWGTAQSFGLLAQRANRLLPPTPLQEPEYGRAPRPSCKDRCSAISEAGRGAVKRSGPDRPYRAKRFTFCQLHVLTGALHASKAAKPAELRPRAYDGVPCPKVTPPTVVARPAIQAGQQNKGNKRGCPPPSSELGPRADNGDSVKLTWSDIAGAGWFRVVSSRVGKWPSWSGRQCVR